MFFLGLISPDASLCHAVSEQLKQAAGDWQQASFATLEDALGAWSDALPPLILWDVEDAPASDELATFFAVKLAQQKPAPMLLVLGDKLPAAIEGHGVTEGFTRPLRLGYLLTRIQFYQRMLQQSPDKSFDVGPWHFAPRARTLTPQAQGGEAIKLTEKEAALLEYLCAASGIVPRDELLASIWGYDSNIDTHTLETHIYRLRRKLMESQPEETTDLFISDQGGYKINLDWQKG